jgi:citrate synthase
MSKTAFIVTTFDRLRNRKPLVEGDPKLGFAANILYTLVGKKPDDVMERAFNVAMILHADHELNAQLLLHGSRQPRFLIYTPRSPPVLAR